MIPGYYDQKDRANIEGVYAVLPGRVITKNGIPLCYIQRCDESRQLEHHAAIDYFTYFVVHILNLYLQTESKVKVLKGLVKR